MSHVTDADEPRVVEALRSSLLLAALVAAMNALWRGVAGARATEVMSQLRREWNAGAGPQRRSWIGTALFVAAVTGLGLTWASDHPAGWLWLVPPAIAATVAVLLLLPSTNRAPE